MKHTAGTLLLLAALAGCASPNNQLDPNSRAPGAPPLAGTGPRPTLTSTPMPSSNYPGAGPAQAVAQASPPRSPYASVSLMPAVSRPVLTATLPASVAPTPSPQSQPGGWNGATGPTPQGQSRSLMPARPVAQAAPVKAAPVQQAAAWQTPEPPPPAAPQYAPVSMVNSRRVPLNFTVDKGGRSRVTNLELWYTHDGGPWQRHPATPTDPPFAAEVEQDGVYGFCLVAYGPDGGVPPGPGEPPQMIVEVDTQAPAVQLLDIQAAQGDEPRLTIYWQAKDKNLAERGVDLLWSRGPDGPWMPIITQCDNTGFYDWKLPAGLPSQFHVRVEAADTARNVGSAQTPGPIVLDGVVSAPLAGVPKVTQNIVGPPSLVC